MDSIHSQSDSNQDLNTARWFEKSHIVAIGINNYMSPIECLNTAVNDAKAIAKIFRENHGFEKPHVLLNEKATKPEIINLLTDLKTIIGKNDRLVFYYAGHGIALPTKNDEKSEDDPQGYLIPQSAKYGETETYLSMSDLIKNLSEVDCRHALIILDCCYAGAIRWSLPTRHMGRAKTIYPTTLDLYINSRAWQILTSSDEDQKANDVMLENNRDRDIDLNQLNKHSPFAYYLIEGLKGKADLFPSKQKDDIITADELHLYLRNVDITTATAGIKKRQTPQLVMFPKKHEKGEFVFLRKDLEAIRKDLPEDPIISDENNPYRGLKSYETSDVDVFFGRTRLIEELCDRVSNSLLTVVLGGSGSGKSSLVKAGLIPHLERTLEDLKKSQLLIPSEETQRHYERHQHQQVITKENVQVIRPGKLPATELEKALACLNLDAIPSGVKYLLVIDQFEEVETQCRDDNEQQKFWQKLVSLLSEEQYKDKLYLILTLRSDFESTLRNKFEVVWEKQTQELKIQKLDWVAARFIVQQMEPQELQEAIEGPAMVKGVYFTADQRNGRTLVQQLVHEVAGMPGALPLLSFALQEIYRELVKRFVEATKQNDPLPKREIRWHDYDKLNGGVTQSITRRATEEYDKLAKDDQEKLLSNSEAQDHKTVLRWIMLRMVAISGGGLARRKVLMSELDYPEPNNKYVEEVIFRFDKARLLVKDRDDQGEYVEPAHDVLIREWVMVKQWIKEIENSEENPSLPQRLTMNAAANEWDNHKNSDGAEEYLWDNSPYLYLFEKTLKPDNNNWLNKLEREFIKRSIQKREKEDIQEKTQIINLFSRSSQVFFYSDQLLAALIEAIKAGKALQKLLERLDKLQTEAILEENEAAIWERVDVVKIQTLIALEQAVYGVRERNRLEGHSDHVESVVFSPDGKTIASGSYDNTVRLWNLNGKEVHTLKGHSSSVYSVVFSPDGKTIATGSYDNTVRLWNLNGQELHTLKGHRGFVNSVVFSPDGKMIASASDDKTVRLWNLNGRKLHTLKGHSDSVKSVVFSPDGKTIATGSNDNTVRLWNLNGWKLHTLKGHRGFVNSVVFSPDGKMIASASWDNTVRLWNFNGEELHILRGHSSYIYSVVFSPDGKMIASGSEDNTVRLWNFNGEELHILNGHSYKITSVVFSPDGKMIASASDDTTVRLWNFDGEELRTLKGHSGTVHSVVFSPDGKMIATGSYDNTVRLWNLNREELRTLGHSCKVNSVVFSPDGKMIASASWENTVRLWNLNGEELRTLNGHRNHVTSVVFSPDGKTIATGSEDDTVRLWNLNGEELRTLNGHSWVVTSVVFSPDGKMIASGSWDNTVRLWNLNGQELHTLKGHRRKVNSVVFSPDGKTIASASVDNTVRLWNLNGQELHTLKGHRGFVNSVVFSPDGKMIASGSNDKTVRLWNLNGQELHTLKGHRRTVHSVVFSPDGKTIATGSDEYTVRLWKMDLDNLLIRGYNWVYDYLKNNPNVKDDSHLCDDVLTPFPLEDYQ